MDASHSHPITLDLTPHEILTGVRTPDAIQVATAIHQRADAFVTNDASMRRIKEIRITLPRAAG